jgi:PAS domain S-box-containing protein
VADRQALQESEARFRNMADTAPVMIWVTGPDKRCTYINTQWLEFTGRTLEEELGHGWANSIHPDDYDSAVETYFTSFDERQPFGMEYRVRRAMGSIAGYSTPASLALQPMEHFSVTLVVVSISLNVKNRKSHYRRRTRSCTS